MAAVCYRNLATCFMKQAKFEQAVVAFERALAIVEAHNGHTHKTARELQSSLAKARRARGTHRRRAVAHTRSRERNRRETRYNPATGRTRPLRAQAQSGSTATGGAQA